MDEHQEMLQRVYHLSSPDEVEGTYDDWAGGYDAELLGDLAYVGPRMAAERFAALVAPGAAVLDAGCGTGLVGAELAERGFTTIDGVDLSQGMLDEARAKGCYRTLQKADLTARLPFDDDTYDATICVGTLTEGHVGPEALDELIRVTRERVVVAILCRIWAPLGYEAYIAGLEERGAARLVESTERPCVEDQNAYVCVIEPR
ncbi:MAG TPA: class I SAM-dependent methyltransferase [Streptosporangiaceae bacterium]|jgi:ubiquinone/menaquinone biosynthesis C-methylase UbiE